MTAGSTGGGTFDPADRHVYFVADNTEVPLPWVRYLLVAVNELMTPAGEKKLVAMLDAGQRVLLDSGIFNLTNKHMRATGITMDEALALPPEELDGFEALFERYVYLTGTYGDRLWGYIELDQGGRETKIRTRRRLHDLGLRPIPVYHPLNDGWEYFDQLAATHDRLCFGNVVHANARTKVRLLHTLWERRRAYPDLWVHVLGLTVNEWCAPIPPDSCDSSAWNGGLRYRDAAIGQAMLTNLLGCPDGLRYATGGGERGYNAATRFYADLADLRTTDWRAVLAETTAGLGLATHPPRHINEGPLAP